MSIASGFRHKWGVVMRAFDASQGGTDDHRFAAASKAADDADLMLIEKRMYAALTETIDRLRSASQAGGVPAGDIHAGWCTEAELVAAYKRGFEWCVENGPDRPYLDKAAFDYADKVLSASPPPPAPQAGEVPAGEWTEGVCADGAAILRDGVPVSIAEILERLNASPPPPATDGDALREALEDCAEYFDQRADADQPHGCDSPIPNEEMSLLIKVRNALASVPTPTAGSKILAGLQAAAAGNLARVTIEGQTWVRADAVEVEQS